MTDLTQQEWKNILARQTRTDEYDFSPFLNGGYDNLEFDNGVTDTSIPYDNNFDNKVKSYYTDYTGSGGSTNFYTNYQPYNAFTNYIIKGIGNHSEEAFKYLQWLVDKTSKDGVEGGDPTLQISTLLNRYWRKNDNDNTYGLVSGLDWTNSLIQNDLYELARRYNTRRTDGKFGWYHMGPKNPSKLPTKQPRDKIPVVEPEEEKEEIEEAQRFSPTIDIKSKYPGWSDWTVLTMQRINDIIGNFKSTNWKKRIDVPLVEPKQHNYKITNGYTERQLLEQQKAELRNVALQDQASDLNSNIRQRMAIENKIDQMTNRQLEIKSNEFARTSEEAQKVADWNSDQRVDAANINRERLAGLKNKIAEIQSEFFEKNNASLNSWLQNMYTDYGEYLKTKRLNENAKKALLAKSQREDDLYTAYSGYNKLKQDPTSWNEIQSFCSALIQDTTQNFENDEIATRVRDAVSNGKLSKLLLDPSVRAWVVEKLTDPNSDSTVVKIYQTRYKAALASAEENAENKARVASKNYYATMGTIDQFATNQWGWRIPTRSERRSVTIGKQGTKIDRFSKLMTLTQKEQSDVRKRAAERDKQTFSNLNKELDRINKEELILLRAIFK